MNSQVPPLSIGLARSPSSNPSSSASPFEMDHLATLTALSEEPHVLPGSKLKMVQTSYTTSNAQLAESHALKEMKKAFEEKEAHYMKRIAALESELKSYSMQTKEKDHDASRQVESIMLPLPHAPLESVEQSSLFWSNYQQSVQVVSPSLVPLALTSLGHVSLCCFIFDSNALKNWSNNTLLEMLH